MAEPRAGVEGPDGCPGEATAAAIPDNRDEDSADEAEPVVPPITPESMAFVGEYASVEAYFRAMLGEAMDPSVVWVLEHVDERAVRRRFEAGGVRYHGCAGSVYRVGQ